MASHYLLIENKVVQQLQQPPQPSTKTTNTSKQNEDFLSTKRTKKDNHKQAVPYPSLGTFSVSKKASSHISFNLSRLSFHKFSCIYSEMKKSFQDMIQCIYRIFFSIVALVMKLVELKVTLFSPPISFFSSI